MWDDEDASPLNGEIDMEDALNRLAATVDEGQGKTAARLMALQLIGGVERREDGWRRGRINLFLCASPATGAGQVFDRISTTFGGVRWYNATAIDNKELIVNSRRADGMTAGVLFDDTVDAVYLDAVDSLRNSTTDGLSTILGVEKYPVKRDGREEVFRPEPGVVLAETPRHGTWQSGRQPTDQLSIDDSLLGHIDAVIAGGGQPSVDGGVEADPMPSATAFEYVRSARQFRPEFDSKADDRVRRFAAAAADGVDNIDDSETRKVSGLLTSDVEDTVRRLSEAAARARLREMVTTADVAVATDLLVGTWSHLGYEVDSESGRPEDTSRVHRAVQSLSETGRARVDEIAEATGLSEPAVRQTVKELKDEGVVSEPVDGEYEASKRPDGAVPGT